MGVIRTQVQLTEEQYRRLKRLAAERSLSLAEVVRRYVDRGLASEEQELEERWERASRVIGAFRSKERDLSTDHDRYLAEAYEE
ncbi:MAG: ribbon-helix-helix protein, CopG family [Planctomycetota bacterium]|jgi:hypothetical protein